jgi:hypothetical protein
VAAQSATATSTITVTPNEEPPTTTDSEPEEPDPGNQSSDFNKPNIDEIDSEETATPPPNSSPASEDSNDRPIKPSFLTDNSGPDSASTGDDSSNGTSMPTSVIMTTASTYTSHYNSNKKTDGAAEVEAVNSSTSTASTTDSKDTGQSNTEDRRDDESTDDAAISESQVQEQTSPEPVSDESNNGTDEKITPPAGDNRIAVENPSADSAASAPAADSPVKFTTNLADTNHKNLNTLLGDPFRDRSSPKILPASATTFEHLRNSLDDLKNEVADDNQFSRLILGSTVTLSLGLSAGYVIWLIRGGMLVASVLSSMPAWQIADPLPILTRKKEDSDSEDNESLESIIKKGEKKADNKSHDDDDSSNVET